MSAKVISFPARPQRDVSQRAAHEHLLSALTHRDALLGHDVVRSTAVLRSMQAGLDGLAEFIRQEYPRLNEDGVANQLRTALAYYCRTTLGVGE